MAYYPDLTPYIYDPYCAWPDLWNVGWLDGEHPYPQGPVSAEFVDRLWTFCQLRVERSRGIHWCKICAVDEPVIVEHNGEPWVVGTAEVRALGAAGQVYAAPDMIYHYVTAHSYRPPDVFIEAILTGPQPDTPAYAEAMQRYGWKASTPEGRAMWMEQARELQRQR